VFWMMWVCAVLLDIWTSLRMYSSRLCVYQQL
jgi:hypothetical protein